MQDSVRDKRAQDREQNMALIWTCRMNQNVNVNKLITLLYIILDISLKN